MTYTALSAMSQSQSLMNRIVAAASLKGFNQSPETTVQQYKWRVISRQDWVTAWQSATDGYTTQFNPDTGARPDVITDTMISDAIDDIMNG